MSDDRLSRIEVKLDKLAEAVVSLARMEERMISLFNRMDKYEEEKKALEQRVGDVEDAVNSNNHKLGFAERVFWVAVTAAIGSGFWFLK